MPFETAPGYIPRKVAVERYVLFPFTPSIVEKDGLLQWSFVLLSDALSFGIKCSYNLSLGWFSGIYELQRAALSFLQSSKGVLESRH